MLEMEPLAVARYAMIIVGGRRLSREALQRLLDTTAFRVAGHGQALAEALRDHPPDTQPDIVVFIVGADADIEGVLPQIARCRAEFRAVTVVLTDCGDPGALFQLVNAGVDSILSRDISASVLENALELVVQGQHLFPPGIAQLVRRPALVESRPVPGFPAPLQTPSPLPAIALRRAVVLSERERQILRCLVNGLPNKLIARELDITEATVKVHVKGLLRKTGMTNRTQAAIWAMNQTPREDKPSNGLDSLLPLQQA